MKSCNNITCVIAVKYGFKTNEKVRITTKNSSSKNNDPSYKSKENYAMQALHQFKEVPKHFWIK